VAVLKLYPIRTTEGTLDRFFDLKNPRVFVFLRSYVCSLGEERMKRKILFALTALTAALAAACGAATDNKPVSNAPNANTSNVANANTASPAPGDPAKEALMETEKKAWEAWKAKDGKFFEEMLADNAVGFTEKGRQNKAATIKRIADPTCEVRNFAIAKDEMVRLGTDAALLTYRATQDATCGGKVLPAAVWAATIVVRSGDKWKAVYHNEFAVPVDRKEPPPKTPAKPAGPASAAKPADAATEALLAVEKKSWDAWKSRDPNGIESFISTDLITLDSSGRYDFTNTKKAWFDAKCDIKGYTISEPNSVSLSKDLSVLTFKASVDGTCEGQPVGATSNTSVYLKDGESWKMVFGTNAAI
jgi:hypothetical protein